MAKKYFTVGFEAINDDEDFMDNTAVFEADSLPVLISVIAPMYADDGIEIKFVRPATDAEVFQHLLTANLWDNEDAEEWDDDDYPDEEFWKELIRSVDTLREG